MDDPKPYRILLVDDSPDDRLLAVREIRKVIPDARIDQAGGLEEFRALLSEVRAFDVAITDYQLRWSTGIEVLRELRVAAPDLPVIMFTASGSEEVAVQAMKEGLDDYITKTAKHYGRIPYAVLACAQRGRQKHAIAAATQALRASEALYRALSDATPDLVSICDPQGRAEFLNRNWYAYTGSTLERFNAEGWRWLTHPDDVPSVERAWTRGGAQGVATELEARYRRHDGAYRWFLARSVPLKDEQGGVVRWVGLATDIHQRKLMEQDLRATAGALEEADRQKDQFLATLAHELRNPMAPIRYAAALIRPEARPEVLRKARATIERQSAQMSRLLDDLLDMSRITRDVIELQCAPVDIARVVQEVVENVRPEAVAQQHALVLDLGSQPAWVDGDLARLQQVVGNLLSNAIKYTPPGGRIDVRVETERDTVCVRIRDTGVGLSPEMLPQLFRLFSQLNRGLAASSGGLGIGLAVSKRLVVLHGGQLEAASTGLGEGAEFSVRLPRIEPGGLAADVPESLGEVASAAPARVLVVDDNEDSAEMHAEFLRGAGYEVAVAYDGPAALARLDAFAPDAALLDIGLPVMSGYELAGRLRDRVPGIRLVALTGYGQDHDRARARDAGFDAHLVKPTDTAALLAALPPPGV